MEREKKGWQLKWQTGLRKLPYEERPRRQELPTLQLGQERKNKLVNNLKHVNTENLLVKDAGRTKRKHQQKLTRSVKDVKKSMASYIDLLVPGMVWT